MTQQTTAGMKSLSLCSVIGMHHTILGYQYVPVETTTGDLLNGALVHVASLPFGLHRFWFVWVVSQGALLSFLDLLATTLPGKSNRLSFRNLANELRSDPGLNDIGR